nr:probable oligoribonuclease [Onthophagus taurus]
MFRGLIRKLWGAHSHIAKNCNNLFTKNMDLETNRIVWIDMEMTGLDVEKDKVLEIACLITDGDLNTVAEGPDIIIHHGNNVLSNMNDWSKRQHEKTGLTEASRKSNIPIEVAEKQLMDFIKKYVTERMSPLAGNSVYMDRMFIKKHLPKIDNYLHYRIIDVSTIKELCQRWNENIYRKAPRKVCDHRALSDIKESIKELKYYKDTFFKV